MSYKMLNMNMHNIFYSVYMYTHTYLMTCSYIHLLYIPIEFHGNFGMGLIMLCAFCRQSITLTKPRTTVMEPKTDVSELTTKIEPLEKIRKGFLKFKEYYK